MKRLLMLISFCGLMACGNVKEEQVVIKGNIMNPLSNIVEVFYFKDYIMNSTEKVVAELDENNNFHAVLPMDKNQMVYIRMGRRNIQLYLKPGAEVNLFVDAANTEASPDISGRKITESAFLLSYNSEMGKKYSREQVINTMVKLDPIQFKSYIHEVYLDKLDYLMKFEDYSNLDPDFISIFQTNIRYEKLGYLMDYPEAIEEVSGQLPELPNDYYDFLDDENLFDDNHLNSVVYLRFLNDLLNHYSQKPEYSIYKDEGFFTRRYKVAQASFMGKSRDFMLSHLMISSLNFESFEKASSYMMNICK
jgi:hypothetical protein